MSLSVDGKEAVAAMLDNAALFARIKSVDWSIAAARLAKKQIISSGLTKRDVYEIRGAIGPEIFERVLADLTAHQAKLLARRLHPTLDADEVKTLSAALSQIRRSLSSKLPDTSADPEPKITKPEQPRSANPYVGRKAFRVR